MKQGGIIKYIVLAIFDVRNYNRFKGSDFCKSAQNTY